MEIIPQEMPAHRIEEYLKKDETLIIKDPPNSLIELYLLSNISQFLGIRAEFDYSIENNVSVKTLGKFNKNYGDLITLIKGAKNVDGFNALITFINNFNGSMKHQKFTKWTNYCFSIKHATSLDECLEYIIFKYNI
jgi:hypothetical protein